MYGVSPEKVDDLPFLSLFIALLRSCYCLLLVRVASTPTSLPYFALPTKSLPLMFALILQSLQKTHPIQGLMGVS